jgi:hypothetical protein
MHTRRLHEGRGSRRGRGAQGEPQGGRGAQLGEYLLHTEYLRSGGAMILTFIEAGASAVISLDMRSAMPEYMVVPPDRTTLA